MQSPQSQSLQKGPHHFWTKFVRSDHSEQQRCGPSLASRTTLSFRRCCPKYASLRVNLLDVDVGKLFHFRFSSFKARTNRKSGTNRKLLDAAAAWLRRAGPLLLAGGEDVLDRRVDFAREERRRCLVPIKYVFMLFCFKQPRKVCNFCRLLSGNCQAVASCLSDSMPGKYCQKVIEVLFCHSLCSLWN